MAVHNSEIAGIFAHIADLLEIKGENAFRVMAYRNAGRTMMGLPKSAADMASQGEDLTQLPGIGKDLAAKIERSLRPAGSRFWRPSSARCQRA